MKLFILFIAAISSVLANDILLLNEEDIEKLRFAVDSNILDETVRQIKLGDTSGITSVINEFADKIFANIDVYVKKNGLDPIILTDLKNDEIPGSSLELTNGRLNGIGTLGRSDDVTVSYISTTNTLDLYFPIVFANLDFTYDYHVKLLLIGIDGNVTGKIEHFSMDVNLEFDLNTYHASVKKVKTSNTGTISLSFHGNGIVNAVVNVISHVVTAIVQPLLKVIIEAVVLTVSNLVVDTINNAIDNVFNPTTDPATTVANLLFM